MKRIIFMLLILAPIAGMAQETNKRDTTLFVNGRKLTIKEHEGKIKVKLYEETSHGDTIENDQIFEGVYLDGQSIERRMALSIPFTKKKYRGRFEPHYAGLYFGYGNLASGLRLKNAAGIDLVASKSWEIGINLFQGSLVLTPDHHWGLVSGLGYGYNSFRIDGNKAFQREDGVTKLISAPDNVTYSQSRLRYNSFRIPLLLEWQQRFGNKGPLFASLGGEAEIRCWINSKVKVDDHEKTLDKNLNIHPVGINLLAQAGYDNWGVYLRYSAFNMFEKDKGPELHPVTFGLVWHW
ncbi:outer membrane beta-barrel protein [uncultured Bacteroides sp.]|uniref:outer membrane beta-barrel protein n=1 Tax=uncultured Bacteroides sp. TaxID=162156 RepID=UPI002AA6572C|nr:outer membrane beta-barrel protein [uncultured Bacteroides sp.]